MKSWWQGLAPRERILISIAAALALLTLTWQFAVNPIIKNQSTTQDQYLRSQATLMKVQDAYMRQRAIGNVVRSAGQGLTGDNLKVAIMQSARDKGIAISRLQGGGSVAIGVVIEQVDPRLALLWLEDIETRLGGQISKLTIEQSNNDMVRLSVDISEVS